jgi:DHA2 family multidrug resistance protein
MVPPALAERGVSSEQLRMMLSHMVDQEAMIVAMNHLFSAITFLAAALIWLGPRQGPMADAPAGH